MKNNTTKNVSVLSMENTINASTADNADNASTAELTCEEFASDTTHGNDGKKITRKSIIDCKGYTISQLFFTIEKINNYQKSHSANVGENEPLPCKLHQFSYAGKRIATLEYCDTIAIISKRSQKFNTAKSINRDIDTVDLLVKFLHGQKFETLKRLFPTLTALDEITADSITILPATR